MNQTSSDISLQWVSESPGKRAGFSRKREPICDHPPHHSGFPRPDLSHGTAPPNPDPAGYEEFRIPDFPKALRTRPRVTWNRFPLFEGQVVSPRLLPPHHSVVMATAVGGRGAGLLSSWPGYPACSAFTQISPSLPFGWTGGWGWPALSLACRGCTSQGPHLQGGRLSCTALRTGTFMKMGLTENDMGLFQEPPGVNEVS